MGKKSINWDNVIQEASQPFWEYLITRLDVSLVESLQNLCNEAEVYIFSGVIRNYFLGIDEIRDLDLVVNPEVDISKFFNLYTIAKNSFGGYKITNDRSAVDLWYLKDTWAYKIKGTLNFDLHRDIPRTAFFNFSSIIYSINNKKFHYIPAFKRFLRTKKMNIVFSINPNYPLCIVNSFYYSDKYKLKFEKALREFLIEMDKKYQFDYEPAQLKHFGKVIYSNQMLGVRISQLSGGEPENDEIIDTTFDIPLSQEEKEAYGMDDEDEQEDYDDQEDSEGDHE